MHFNEFLQLDETEQIETLWYNGEQIGRRTEQGYLILLYQVEGFYVEVFYHRKERAIKKYVSFDCADDRLLPYLEKIDISAVHKQLKKRYGFTDHLFVKFLVSLATDKPYRKPHHPSESSSFVRKVMSLFVGSK